MGKSNHRIQRRRKIVNNVQVTNTKYREINMREGPALVQMNNIRLLLKKKIKKSEM